MDHRDDDRVATGGVSEAGHEAAPEEDDRNELLGRLKAGPNVPDRRSTSAIFPSLPKCSGINRLSRTAVFLRLIVRAVSKFSGRLLEGGEREPVPLR
jgi:hypothetical protein